MSGVASASFFAQVLGLYVAFILRHEVHLVIYNAHNQTLFSPIVGKILRQEALPFAWVDTDQVDDTGLARAQIAIHSPAAAGCGHAVARFEETTVF